MWLTSSLVAAHGLLSCGMQTLSRSMHLGSSSLTRDRTRARCIGSSESYTLRHQGSPCRSFLVTCKSPEYIWTAVVLTEFILVIQSQQILIGHILCTAHFALGPEKSKRTKAPSLIFKGLLVH